MEQWHRYVEIWDHNHAAYQHDRKTLSCTTCRNYLVSYMIWNVLFHALIIPVKAGQLIWFSEIGETSDHASSLYSLTVSMLVYFYMPCVSQDRPRCWCEKDLSRLSGSAGEVLEGIHITMPYTIGLISPTESKDTSFSKPVVWERRSPPAYCCSHTAAYMIRDYLRGDGAEHVNEETVGRLTGILVGAVVLSCELFLNKRSAAHGNIYHHS